jgi:hypothetical protein
MDIVEPLVGGVKTSENEHLHFIQFASGVVGPRQRSFVSFADVQSPNRFAFVIDFEGEHLVVGHDFAFLSFVVEPTEQDVNAFVDFDHSVP